MELLTTPVHCSADRRCDELHVLLIDDDPVYRAALAGILRDDGHVVDEYECAPDDDVLGTLGRADLVIADYQLPGTNGLHFADHFHVLFPATPIVLMTAHASDDLMHQVAQRDFICMHWKWLGYDDLHRALHRLSATDGGLAR